jgi:hypothetical protein
MRQSVPAIPSDPGLAGARGLFGDEGTRLLSSFLEDRGWTLEAARPVQALFRPGRSCGIRYRVQATGRRGRRAFTLCAETRARRRPVELVPPAIEQRTGLGEPVERVGDVLVWAFPYDPALPGLPDAAWGPAVRGRLTDEPRAVSVEPLRYRPRRRAVFRYRLLRSDGRGRRWETAFGKVLPGDKAARVRSLGLVLRNNGPGLALALPTATQAHNGLVFEPLPGRSLRQLLLAGGSLPAPERVAALPDRLASSLDGPEPHVEELPDGVATAVPTVRLIERLVPRAAPCAHRVLDAVARGDSHSIRRQIVHGDLYEAQVFVDEDFSLGLIDLDDVGVGDPAMDGANFCAHLLALALAVPSATERLSAYRTVVRRAFLERLGLPEAAFAWREALCMLLLATGPFRVLDPAWPDGVRRRAEVAVRLLGEG